MTAKRSKKDKILECDVRDAGGKKIGSVKLDSKVFDGNVNIPLLQQVVKMYQANQRAGTASAKTRAEVSGGGKKPWRQKGTGRARTGSIRNPLWRGGGIIFGPKPRDFSFVVPKQMKHLAIKSSLNEKLLEGTLIVINELKLAEPKTKLFYSMLCSLGVDDKEKAIFILDKKLDPVIKRASRNIPNVKVKTLGNFNAIDLLRHKKLVIQESALLALMKGLQ